MMSPPVKNAAEATILALTLASDPLAWVSERASSGQEFPMAFASRHAFVRVLKSRCAAREISCRQYSGNRRPRGRGGAQSPQLAQLDSARFGVSKMITDWSVDATHANAAATLIALRYDGSSRATIAAALLSPRSSHYLGAFRRSVLDDYTFGVRPAGDGPSMDAWASPHGFPPANAMETRSGRIGIAAVAAAVAIDATLALAVGDGAGALAAAVTSAIMAAIGLAARRSIGVSTFAITFGRIPSRDSWRSWLQRRWIPWSPRGRRRRRCRAVCVVQAWAATGGEGGGRCHRPALH